MIQRQSSTASKCSLTPSLTRNSSGKCTPSRSARSRTSEEPGATVPKVPLRSCRPRSVSSRLTCPASSSCARSPTSTPAECQSVGLTRLFHTLQQQLDDDYLKAITFHLRQLRVHDGVLISAGLDRDNNGTCFVLHSADNYANANRRKRLGSGPRSAYSFTIRTRDYAGAQALADLTGRGINLVADAAAQSADHISSYFTMLRAELGFYVACLNLRDRLAAKGQPTSFPEPSTWPSLKLNSRGLSDVGLALQTHGRVVGNDFDADGKQIVIITGTSSGGKSTFLRSVGSAQLMMQCGMFVTAESYQASVFDGVFTHFSREEDPTMTSGRLDEELGRMSRIADQIDPHGLMLFNESFAATNEREGSEIGRQVVQALLDADVRVFFVTHQFDFAESFRHHGADNTLFLRAPRHPEGQRSYKLAAADPLPTNHGEDLYHRLGGWLDEDHPEIKPATRTTSPRLFPEDVFES
jgi:MutS-like protein